MKINREEIINTTLQLAKELSWQNTSVRQISKKIGYSTIKIYSEFKSKEGLLIEVQKQGFQLLKQAYINGIKKETIPEEQFISLCIEHYKFAKKKSVLL